RQKLDSHIRLDHPKEEAKRKEEERRKAEIVREWKREMRIKAASQSPILDMKQTRRNLGVKGRRSERILYECYDCDFESKSRQKLDFHVRLDHPETESKRKEEAKRKAEIVRE
ncbi:hypothetical protein PFISCL1PPCAC_8882, partial [Pristionchus fissidentatus]